MSVASSTIETAAVERLRISIDVVAYNDVTILDRVKPRTAAQLDDFLVDVSCTLADGDGRYDTYVRLFHEYQHDAGAQAYKASRRRGITRPQARVRR